LNPLWTDQVFVYSEDPTDRESKNIGSDLATV
jgi:hypothetical protein